MIHTHWSLCDRLNMKLCYSWDCLHDFNVMMSMSHAAQCHPSYTVWPCSLSCKHRPNLLGSATPGRVGGGDITECMQAVATVIFQGGTDVVSEALDVVYIVEVKRKTLRRILDEPDSTVYDFPTRHGGRQLKLQKQIYLQRYNQYIGFYLESTFYTEENGLDLCWTFSHTHIVNEY